MLFGGIFRAPEIISLKVKCLFSTNMLDLVCHLPPSLDAIGASSLNQTPGWGYWMCCPPVYCPAAAYIVCLRVGVRASTCLMLLATTLCCPFSGSSGEVDQCVHSCESGDAFGSGTSFDSGVGTNQPDTGVWDVYSAVGDHGGAAPQHTQLWDGTYTDSQGTVYDGSGWWVTDSYSCNADDCGAGGYGTASSAFENGTTSLKVSEFAVADSSGRLGGPIDVGQPCSGVWCESVPDTSQHALVAPTMTATVVAQPANKTSVRTRATPAHLALTAHALTLGLLSATDKLLRGDSKGWLGSPSHRCSLDSPASSLSFLVCFFQLVMG